MRNHSPSAAATDNGALSSRHASAARPAADTPRSTRTPSVSQIALRMAIAQLAHEAQRRGPDGEAPAVELLHGPNAEQRIRREYFVGREQLGRKDVALLDAEAEPSRRLED